MAQQTFRRGRRYWSGIDKPLLLPTDLVRGAAANRGFLDIGLFDRDDPVRPNPPNVQRHAADSSWDMLATAVWPLNDQELDVPNEVKWIEEDATQAIDVPGSFPPGTLPGIGGQEKKPAEPPGLSPLAIAGIVGGSVLIVGLVVVVARSSRRKNPRRRYRRPTF